jgi:threonine dehydratase
MLPALKEIESATAIVREVVLPTPQICWPLLCKALGAAAGVAAAMQEKSRIAGRRVAVVLTGGNVDREVFAAVLGAAC